MWIGFSEEHLMLMDMVREFTKNEVARFDKQMDIQGFDAAIFKKLANIGLTGLLTPEKYGGSGWDAVASAITVRELARGSGSVALTIDGQYMVTEMLTEYGTEEQKQRYLPMGAEGSLYAFALTEPSGGSDAASMKTRATFDSEHGQWVINGSKAWITNVPEARLTVLMAQTEPDAGTKGITAFLVPSDTEGVLVGRHEEKLGMRGSSTAEIFLDNVRLPQDAVLGKPGKGFKYAMECLDGARISVAAICVGIAEHAMELAKAYANERVAFGKTIGRFQGVSFKFADMATLLYAGWLMVCNTAKMKDAGMNYSLQAAETKLFCSEAASKICNECIQIFGGYGYSLEYDVQRLWRDVRILEIGEGTSEILRNLIGKKVLSGR